MLPNVWLDVKSTYKLNIEIKINHVFACSCDVGEKKIGAIKSDRGVGHMRQIARENEEKEDALQGLKVSTFILFVNNIYFTYILD